LLVLSLFPGIGLLDHAFELEGSCVVRGPDVIWGGDIRSFHPPSGVFAGIIGGPPCQSFSSLAQLVRANGHEPKFGNLIPEFERCVSESQPDWFLMENVPAAPEPKIEGYGMTPFMLDNSHLESGDGWGHEQRRIRKFCFGTRGRPAPNLMRWIDLAVFFLPAAVNSVNGAGPGGTRGFQRRTVTSNVGGFTDGSPNPKYLHEAVTGAHDKPPSARIGGQSCRMRRYKIGDALRLQGLPETWLDHCPMTAEGKLKAVANGVCIFTGKAIARAIRCALEEQPHAT
jgi:DNA (cytosine-5)-methyltransferase 1